MTVTKVAIVAGLSAWMLLMAVSLGVSFANQKEVTATVTRIEKIQNIRISGDSALEHTYFLLFTTAGVYQIDISGIFSRSELLGRIKPDSTYTFKTIGVSIPWAGIYPSIISLK